MDDSAFVRVGSAFLPVLPSGKVHEIVWFAKEPSVPEGLSIRPLGWFERTWRMAWRVFNTWLKLDRAQRRQIGLTLGRAIIDLPAAYRAATSLRGIGYSDWCATADTLTAADRKAILAQISRWGNGPRFFIRRLPGDADTWVDTRASLNTQLYRNFFLDYSERINPQLDDWLILLRPGDRLPLHALYWAAHAIRQSPRSQVVYWDDDEMDAAGQRLRPRFKPGWSRLHLMATDYIGRAVAVKRSALVAQYTIGSAESLREAILAITAGAREAVAHIPAILLHRLVGDALPACQRVPVALPDVPPKVSILIPTRDALPLLRQCVGSVLAKTDYPDFEVVVIDNGSSDPAALAYLASLATEGRARVLNWNKPFNYSAINNFAARQVQGEVLCLLNNDTEVIAPDWLDEMVGHLCRDKVGSVGAKLYYPDGRVQHGGDTVGPGGCANHLHQFIARDDPGYCNRAIVAQELSAVTAACMVTWRDLYLRLGGLNERWLPVAFNDVDYCLRVRQAGYKVMWTPHAELYHHESVSRGKDRGWRKEFRAWREVKYMRWKWREAMKNDPFYNPNFSYLRADFALSLAPNVKRPWEGLGIP